MPDEVISNIDPLTDLPSRQAWVVNLEEKINSRRPLIIMTLDIKDLKDVNSSYGYLVGNISLIAAADIIKSSLRPNDFVARTGEDDFGIIIAPSAEKPQKILKTIAERLIDRILDYNSDHQVPISLDIGGAFSLKCPHDIQSLVSKAAKAMYSRSRKDK